MEWFQVLSIIVSILATMLWARSESRSDIRELDARLTATMNANKEDMTEKINAHKTDMTAAMNAHKAETTKILDLIREESRDFHGRLCAIEERYREDQHRSCRKRRRY